MTSSPKTATVISATTVALIATLGAAVPAEAAPTPTPTPTPTISVLPLPTATPTPTPTVTPTPTSTPTPTVPPAPIVPLPTATSLSQTSGHASSSRTVVLTGTNFSNLAGIQVAGVAIPTFTFPSATQVRFVLPNAIDYQAKVATISLTARSDWISRPTAVTFTYKVVSNLDRQMAYAFANWNNYSNARFGYLSGNDCANFASQTLLARGWAQSADWFNYGAGRWSSTWVSSTALSTWLQSRPDLATHLVYSQRDSVAVGDVIQFRWPGHTKKYASWDHTGIVSKVVVLPDGRHDIYYISHTLNRQYGGSTQMLANWYGKQNIKGSTLRIQFFHLNA